MWKERVRRSTRYYQSFFSLLHKTTAHKQIDETRDNSSAIDLTGDSHQGDSARLTPFTLLPTNRPYKN